MKMLKFWKLLLCHTIIPDYDNRNIYSRVENYHQNIYFFNICLFFYAPRKDMLISSNTDNPDSLMIH